jgi:coenzyme F420-reducing hydrogenase alpha subunit
VYRVGPLGRLNIAEKIDTPLANEELQRFKASTAAPVENTLYYHYARLIEALFAAERVRELLRRPRYPQHRYPQHPPGLPGRGRGRHRSPARHPHPPLLGQNRTAS